MNFKKTIQENWPLVLIALLFLASRLTNLTGLPIFTDESIYLLWARELSLKPTRIFISLSDGKQPLFIWLSAIGIKLYPDAYLFWGRLVSVLAGLFTLIGTYFVAQNFFQKKSVAILSSILVLLSPYLLFHDRLAIMDSLMAAFGIWVVYFGLKLQASITASSAAKESLKKSVILGFVLGFALLVKSPAAYFAFLLPLNFIFFEKKKLVTYKQTIIYYLLSIFLAKLIYFPLRLSKAYFIIAMKNRDFVLTLSEFLRRPMFYFPNNVQSFFGWLGEYFTWPVFSFVLFSLLYGLYIKRYRNQSLYIFIYAFLPFLSISLFGKIIFPRYLLFITPLLLVLLSNFLIHLGRRLKLAVFVLLLFLLFLPALIFNFKILTSPPDAPLPGTDQNQYIKGEASGYGLEEVYQFLENGLEKNQRVYLVTEGTFGLFPYAIQLRFYRQLDRLKILDYYPLPTVFDDKVVSAAKQAPTYLLLKDHQKAEITWNAKLIFAVPKPKSDRNVLLYQIVP
jgi:hypothetical protein